MSTAFDLVVIGAGPAGAAAAITAADRGLGVLLLEAGVYPRHKVCGEFVSAESAEVLRYLLHGDASIMSGVPRVSRARLHSGGHSVEMRLEHAAYSIPRIRLDDELWRTAALCGVACRVETVHEVNRSGNEFLVSTSKGEYSAKSVVNASGRWSRISRRARTGTPWIGLKAHFSGETDDAVDLYFAGKGYCGVQAVADGVLNACALARQGSAKTLQDVFEMDASLASRSRQWKQVTEVFATAPVYLGPGEPVFEGMLQAGDAAGFVDPFVGDGISLALRSGVLAGRCAGAVSAEEYAQIYRRAFAGIFRSTGRVRTMVRFARPLRPVLIRAFQWPGFTRQVFSRTRQARLDVMQVPIG